MSANSSPDPVGRWGPFQHLLGRWIGKASGKVGDGTVERTYEVVLGGQFIQVKNRSEYPPQQANQSGEVHEDVGLISYDKARNLFVMREFHNEGYVNQYVLQPPADMSSELVFVTESIENISPGWRARTILRVTSEDSFRETFDLAGPEKEWACFITNEFTRINESKMDLSAD
jgi:hypothetical protein